MRIVITGAGGFIGQALIAALIRQGHDVVGIGLSPRPACFDIEWHRTDLFVDALPAAALAGAEALVHLAWRNIPGRGNDNMSGDLSSNVAASLRIFEAAARSGLRRIVYASSGGTIYGNAPVPTPETAPIAPIGGYGAGKAAAELYLGAIHHAFGIEACALRVANPYGPGQYPNRGQGFIATAMARTLAGEPIDVFGDPATTRDYIYIDDVADCFVKACLDRSPKATFNVGSGIERSLTDLIPLIFNAVGHKTAVNVTPGRPMDVPRMALDPAKAGQILGWRPTTDMSTGLERTRDWLSGLNPKL
jgi:UDP-glucose 4-epimerase